MRDVIWLFFIFYFNTNYGFRTSNMSTTNTIYWMVGLTMTLLHFNYNNILALSSFYKIHSSMVMEKLVEIPPAIISREHVFSLFGLGGNEELSSYSYPSCSARRLLDGPVTQCVQLYNEWYKLVNYVALEIRLLTHFPLFSLILSYLYKKAYFWIQFIWTTNFPGEIGQFTQAHPYKRAESRTMLHTLGNLLVVSWCWRLCWLTSQNIGLRTSIRLQHLVLIPFIFSVRVRLFRV